MKRLIKKCSLQDWGISLENLDGNIDVPSGYKLDNNIVDKINDAYYLYDQLRLIKKVPEVNASSYNLDELKNIDIKSKYFQKDIDYIKENINTIIININKIDEIWDKLNIALKNAKTEKDFENPELIKLQKQFTSKEYPIKAVNGYWHIYNPYMHKMIKNKNLDLSEDIYCDKESVFKKLKSNDLDFIDFLNSINTCNNGGNKSYSTVKYLQDFIFPNKMGSDWDTYVKYVEEYIHSSSPDYINKIESIVNKYPELKQILDYYASNLTVYRGLSFRNREDYENMLNNNDNFRYGYVSGATNIDIATKFASSNDFGLVFTCKTNDLIYSWKLLSGYFDESEVIFNSDNCEIIDVKELSKNKEEY
jgi:hypothetical protein